MKIYKNEKFISQLDDVLDFIAIDSLNQAIIFNRNLEIKINSILNMPYKFRQSIHFDDENIRDLIFKGYTIPYFIDEENRLIIILGIIKYRKK